MDSSTPGQNGDKVLEVLRLLEGRVARIEGFLGLQPMETQEEPSALEAGATQPREEDELEYEIGQNWFAKAGIVVMAIGIAFLLTFPYKGVPDFVPGVAGYLIVAVIFGLSRFWRDSFPLISRYLFGGAMALSYFSTLRLFFFGTESTLTTDTLTGALLLIAIVVFNIALAMHRKSVYLMSMSLTMGFVTAIVTGSTAFLLTAVTVLSGFAAFLHVRSQFPGLLAVAIPLAYLTHLTWALNNPFLGNAIQLVHTPQANIYFVLAYAVAFALGVLLRHDSEPERLPALATAVVNGFAAYGIFLLLTLTDSPGSVVVSHLMAAIVFIALAITFWIRKRSIYSTPVYVMIGYMALTVAILERFVPPNIFIWLSLVSIIVVSTAVWFRSRFIVVANFFVYITIVLAAFLVAPGEISRASIWFGVVALLTARILNWQQDRLELRTEMMRNAYLLSAFFLFPYAMYHLVPSEYLSVSWIGIAIVYYALSAIIKAQKYRWMGHLTLILTILSVLIIGITKLSQEYRIVSFLALGCVLVVVSLVYNRVRSRRRKEQTEAKGDEKSEGR